MSVLYFLLMLGALVAVHEFGHFVAAKLLDFRVVRFSIGVGRPLLRLKTAETEYRVGLVPFGGYVQIYGETRGTGRPRSLTEPGATSNSSDDEVDTGDGARPGDEQRAFHARPMWQRVVVLLAGPAANLLLPVFIYFYFSVGQSQLPAAVIGDVIPDRPAARAGLEPGDRVLAVDGQSIRYWEELEAAVANGVGERILLRIRRGERTFDKYIVPVEDVRRNRDGRVVARGWIGVSQAPFLPRIGVIDPRSPAGRAGLRTGDLIAGIDGRRVSSFTEVSRELDRDGRRHTLAYYRPTASALPTVRVYEPGIADLVPESRPGPGGRPEVVHGIAPADMFVARVRPGTPAEKAGLRAGDLITALDGRPIGHWLLLDQALQAAPDATWRIAWLRTTEAGTARAMEADLVQTRERVVDEFGNASMQLVFGAVNASSLGEGEMAEIDNRLSHAFVAALDETNETVREMTLGFWSLMRGETPHESVGGPIMMYRAASVSGSKGLNAFLRLLALISVNLGLINLLPIPLLDGGVLVLLGLERVTRRSLTAEQRQLFRRIGWAVIAAIMILALRNDVVRYFLP